MDHLSDRLSKFQRRIILLWAIAVMWIYIGNIINFHQHHIWGKQLIPVACTSNRSKEKSIIKYQGVNGLSFNAGSSPFFCDNGIQSVILVYGNTAAVHFSYSDLFLKPGSLMGTPLRAPPVA
jgi:hypothetical protein